MGAEVVDLVDWRIPDECGENAPAPPEREPAVHRQHVVEQQDIAALPLDRDLGREQRLPYVPGVIRRDGGSVAVKRVRI